MKTSIESAVSSLISGNSYWTVDYPFSIIPIKFLFDECALHYDISFSYWKSYPFRSITLSYVIIKKMARGFTQSTTFAFDILAECSTSMARVAQLKLPHHTVDTPVFMPVSD